MSFLNKIFSSSLSSETLKFWNKIESEEDLNAAIQHSKEKPVVIFKHSTRCIISKTVLRNFENEVKNSSDSRMDFYYLDLLNYRNISNKIAENLGVTHQSPQAILLINQKAVYNASHDGISLESIKKYSK